MTQDQPSQDRPLHELSIRELDLPKRVRNALRAQGVNTIGDLTAYSLAELALFPKLGPFAVNEIITALQAVGLDLKKPDAPASAIAIAEPQTA